MICRRIEPLLSRLMDGRLSERDATTVTAHLRDCPICRRHRDRLAAVNADLGSLNELPAPSRLEARVAARWLQEQTAGTPGCSALPPAARHPRVVIAWVGALIGIAVSLTVGHMHARHRDGSLQRAARPPVAVREPLVLTPALPHDPQFEAPPPHLSMLGERQPPRTTNRLPSPSIGRGAGGEGRLPGLVHHGETTQATDPSPRSTPLPNVLTATTDNARPDQSGAPRLEEWEQVERRVRGHVQIRDDFVTIPFPRVAAASGPQVMAPVRQYQGDDFTRTRLPGPHDRPIAAAIEQYQREAAVVDSRLTREVTLQQKATALTDLCGKLRADTGISLRAGPSVADEKVTVFCSKQPLREVMRQLSRPFGYTWLRSGKSGEYRYELAQDLKSQLLEEELRNRDRREALIALDREIQRFRPYLDLSPDEALEKMRSAPPAEKKVLERLAGLSWGVAQLYFRLSPEQLNTLRAGHSLEFRADPQAGELSLPPELEASVLSSLRDRRLVVSADGVQWGYAASLPTGLPPAQVEGARPLVHVTVVQSELGQFTLEGDPGFTVGDATLRTSDDTRAQGPVATGRSPSAQRPNNAAANARFQHDPALQRRISVRPADPTPSPSPRGRGDSGTGRTTRAGGVLSPPSPSGGGARDGVPAARVTSADVLEALHRATGMPIIADYYTRLYPSPDLSTADERVYDALNRVSDAMRLRWRKEAGWLQFRSSSYFHDRLKEVPNRLLHRWATARRERGWVALDEVIEIAGLSDAQLDASAMAEGAKTSFGLEEWDLARSPNLRPHWRFLAGLTPAQRQQASGEEGLSFSRLPLPQQQEFLRQALGSTGDATGFGLQELATTMLKIDYSVPGWHQWPGSGTPDGAPSDFILRPVVREQTRAAALAAARRIDARVTESDIRPTLLDGVVIYTIGTVDNRHAVRIVRSRSQSFSTD
jgi:hypothetical protein